MFGHSARALFWIKNTLVDCARGPRSPVLLENRLTEDFAKAPSITANARRSELFRKIFSMNFSHRIR